MNEDFIYEAIVFFIWLMLLIPFMVRELLQKRKALDEFTRTKLMKVGRFAYDNFVKENPKTAKERTAQFMREVYKNGELNNKYDLLSEISK